MPEVAVARPRRQSIPLSAVWAFAAVVAPAIRILASRMPTVDLAYHVRAGSGILDAGALPGPDVWTFTSGGARWLDQQWGAQVVLGLAHRAGGWASVVALGGALVAASFFLLYRACRDAGARPRAAAALCLLAFFVASPDLPVRPQLFGVALFALSQFLVGRRHRNPVTLWVVVTLAAVWANVHGSFPLAVILLVLAWLEDMGARREGARRALLASVAAVAATLANPYGWKVWSYAIGIATNPTIRSSITEWRPPTIRTYAGLSFLVSVVAAGVFLARRRERVGWIPLVRLAVFFAIALPAVRGTVWWAFAAPLVLSGLMGEPRLRDEEGSRVLNLAIAFTLVAALVASLPWFRDGSTVDGAPSLLRGAPQGLVVAVRDQVPAGDRLFVSQTFASWFEYAAPGYQVFVDSRIELLPDRAWADYFAVSSAHEGWEGVLDRYGVSAVIVSRVQSPRLLAAISESSSWTLAVENADGAVFVRG